MLIYLIRGGLSEVPETTELKDSFICTWQLRLHTMITKTYSCEITEFQREKVPPGIFNKEYIT